MIEVRNASLQTVLVALWLHAALFSGPIEDQNVELGDVQLENVNLLQVVEFLAVKKRVPLVLELAAQDRAWIYSSPDAIGHSFSNETLPRFSIDIKTASVGDVINEALQFNPSYVVRPISHFLHILPKDALTAREGKRFSRLPPANSNLDC